MFVLLTTQWDCIHLKSCHLCATRIKHIHMESNHKIGIFKTVQNTDIKYSYSYSMS
jgi:hypothetical protein